jgi:hypothetical protein
MKQGLYSGQLPMDVDKNTLFFFTAEWYDSKRIVEHLAKLEQSYPGTEIDFIQVDVESAGNTDLPPYIPCIILLDKKENKVTRHMGEISNEELDSLIK